MKSFGTRGRVFRRVITNISNDGMAFETSGSTAQRHNLISPKTLIFKLRRCEKRQISHFQVSFYDIY
jgi:hypothetical protein